MIDKLIRLPHVTSVSSIEGTNQVIDYANALAERLERAWDDIDGVVDAILKQRPHIEKRDSKVKNMNEKTLGQTAFEAYKVSKNNIAYDGKPIPEWPELAEEVRKGWEAAASSVVTAYFGQNPRDAHSKDNRQAKPL